MRLIDGSEYYPKKVGKLIDDKTILAGLNFGIERGSLVAIIGDNEAGKSLLLKVISASEYQEYGQVYIDGIDSKKTTHRGDFKDCIYTS